MPISLTIPTNWDDKLLSAVRQVNSSDEYRVKIGQVYGAVPTNIGDGRMDSRKHSDDEIKNHIKIVHNIGLPFNFLINAPSMNGIEHDHTYRSGIIETIKWIVDIETDIVTISNPFLGEIIQYHFPKLKIKISTIADIKTVQSIKLLEKLGPKIDAITLSFNINREFDLIKRILNHADFKIELLANIICLLNCPFQWYHYDFVGNYTKLNVTCRLPFKDYDPLGCDIIRLNNVGEIIRSPWIRPEDIGEYERIGVSSIKLAGRTWQTPTIVRMIKAYSKGYYDGNLWDLIAPWMPINIDNNALGNFIQFFIKKDFSCSSECGNCQYCDEIAQKCVHLKPHVSSYVGELQKKLEARLNTRILPEGSEYSPDAFFTKLEKQIGEDSKK